MILALTIAIGTSSFWPVAWMIPLIATLRDRKSNLTGLIPTGSLFTLMLIVALSWFSGSAYAGAWLMTVWVLFICRDSLKVSRFSIWPIVAGVAVHTGLIFWQYSQGIERVTGLQHNASILAMTGFSLFPYGAIVAGLSLSRTVLLAVGLFAVMTKSRTVWIAAAVTFILSIGVGILITPERYNLPGINRDWITRNLAITGENTVEDRVVSEILDVPTVERKWKFTGYGWNRYTPETGKIAPHNMFVLAWWEFGALSILFWIALFRLWKTASGDWRLLLSVVTIGLFTVDLYSRIEGIYVVIGIHTLCNRYAHWQLGIDSRIREIINAAAYRYWRPIDIRWRKFFRTGEPPGGYETLWPKK